MHTHRHPTTAPPARPRRGGTGLPTMSHTTAPGPSGSPTRATHDSFTAVLDRPRQSAKPSRGAPPYPLSVNQVTSPSVAFSAASLVVLGALVPARP